MEELYVEGLATHGDPESCVDDLRGRGEALTGARAGRAIEPRNGNPGCPRCLNGGRQHCRRRYARVAGGPRAVGEPGHVRNLHAREPGEPVPVQRDGPRTGSSVPLGCRELAKGRQRRVGRDARTLEHQSRCVTIAGRRHRAISAVRSGQGCLGSHQLSRADPGCSVRILLAWASTGVDCGRASVTV